MPSISHQQPLKVQNGRNRINVEGIILTKSNGESLDSVLNKVRNSTEGKIERFSSRDIKNPTLTDATSKNYSISIYRDQEGVHIGVLEQKKAFGSRLLRLCDTKNKGVYYSLREELAFVPATSNPSALFEFERALKSKEQPNTNTNASNLSSTERVSKTPESEVIEIPKAGDNNLSAVAYSENGAELQKLLTEIQNTPTSTQTHAYNVEGELGGEAISKAANVISYLLRDHVSTINTPFNEPNEVFQWLEEKIWSFDYGDEDPKEISTEVIINSKAAFDALSDCCKYLSQRPDSVTKEFVDELRSLIGCDTGKDNQVYFALLSADSDHLLGADESYDIIPAIDTTAREIFSTKFSRAYRKLTENGTIRNTTNNEDLYTTLKAELVEKSDANAPRFSQETFDALYPQFAYSLGYIEESDLQKDATSAIRIADQDLNALEIERKIPKEDLTKAVQSLSLAESVTHFDAENILKIRSERQEEQEKPGKKALRAALRSLIFGSERATTNRSNFQKLIKYLPSEFFTTEISLNSEEKTLLELIHSSDLFDKNVRIECLCELIRYQPTVARVLGEESLLKVIDAAISTNQANIDELIKSGLGDSIFVRQGFSESLQEKGLVHLSDYLKSSLPDENLLNYLHDSTLNTDDDRTDSLFDFLREHPGALRSLNTDRILEVLNLAIKSNQEDITYFIEDAFSGTITVIDVFDEPLSRPELAEINQLLRPILESKTEGGIVTF